MGNRSPSALCHPHRGHEVHLHPSPRRLVQPGLNVLPRVWFLGACRKVPRAAAVSPAPPTPAWLVPLGSFPSHPPGTGADRCRGNTTDSWVSPAQVTNLSASVHRPPTQQPLADWSHLISCRPMSSASPGILRSPQSPCRAAAIQTLSAVSRLVKPLALRGPQRRRVQAGSQANDMPRSPAQNPEITGQTSGPVLPLGKNILQVSNITKGS